MHYAGAGRDPAPESVIHQLAWPRLGHQGSGASDTSSCSRLIRVRQRKTCPEVQAEGSAVRKVFGFSFNTSCSSRPNFAFSHAIERQIRFKLALQPPIDRRFPLLAVAQSCSDLEIGQGPDFFGHVAVLLDAISTAQPQPRQSVKNFKGKGESPVQVVGCFIKPGLRMWINAATAGLRRIMGTYNFGTSHCCLL